MKKYITALFLLPCLLCSSCSYLIMGSWGRDPGELQGNHSSVIQQEFGEATDTFQIGNLSANQYAVSGCWENKEAAMDYAGIASMTLLMSEILTTPVCVIDKTISYFNDEQIVLVLDQSEEVIDYKWLPHNPYVKLKKVTHGVSLLHNDSHVILRSGCAETLLWAQYSEYRKVCKQFMTHVQNGNTEAIRHMISSETLRKLDFSALQNEMQSKFADAVEYIYGRSGLAEDEHGNIGIYYNCVAFKPRTTGDIQREGTLQHCGSLQISVFEENGRLLVVNITGLNRVDR